MGNHLVEYRFACGRRASGGHLMGASKARWYGWVAVALTLAMVVAESAPLNMAPEEEATPPLAALRAKAKAFRESRTGRLRKMVADAEREYGEVAEDGAGNLGESKGGENGLARAEEQSLGGGLFNNVHTRAVNDAKVGVVSDDVKHLSIMTPDEKQVLSNLMVSYRAKLHGPADTAAPVHKASLTARRPLKRAPAAMKVRPVPVFVKPHIPRQPHLEGDVGEDRAAVQQSAVSRLLKEKNTISDELAAAQKHMAADRETLRAKLQADAAGVSSKAAELQKVSMELASDATALHKKAEMDSRKAAAESKAAAAEHKKAEDDAKKAAAESKVAAAASKLNQKNAPAAKKVKAASKKAPAASKKAPAASKRKPVKKTPAAKKKASSKRSPPAGKKKKAASKRSSATKRPLAAKEQNVLVETKVDTKKPAAKANEADRKSAISTGKRILKRIQDQKKSIEAERRSTESSRAAKNAAEAAKKRAQAKAQAKAQARSKAKTTAKAKAKAGAKGKKAHMSWENKAEEQLATDMKEIAVPPETKKVVVTTQTPAAKAAPPGMTKKASAEKKKAPSKKKAPVVKKKAPVATKKAPVATTKAPSKKQAPTAKKAPVAKKKAPVKKQTHAATKKAPVGTTKAPSKKKAPVVKKKAPVKKQTAPPIARKKVMAQTTLAKKAEKLAEEVTERTPVSVVQLRTPPVAPGLAHKEATILAQEKMAAMARQYDQQQMRAEQALLENNEMGEARDVRQENEAAVERAKARFMEDTAALNKVERVHTRSPSLLQRPQPLRDTQARPKHTITQLQKPSLSKHLQKKLANAAEQLAEKTVVGEDAKRAYQYAHEVHPVK